MNQKSEKLFSEFSKVSKQEWKDKIVKDLRGAEYEKLIWKTENDIDVQPFYTQDDLKELEYLVKNHNVSFDEEIAYLGARQWKNIQHIEVDNEKEANRKALLALNNGCDGVSFNLVNFANTNIDFNILLNGLYLEDCTIFYIINNNTVNFINELKEYTSKNNFDFNKLKGSIISNENPNAEFINLTKNNHTFKTVSIAHQSDGQNIINKVAELLINTVQSVKTLSEDGISIQDIFDSIQLHYKISNDYFFEIAALRAVRMLITEIAHQYGLKEFKASDIAIHTDTFFELTDEIKENPYLNMLGNTTQAMSAIIGGCNTLTVIPYNKGIEKTDDFSDRISRNVSNILKEESYLDKVNDPVAGSYYIEKLTDQIAEKAWDKFREEL